ncbi:SCP-2 sterol transfer family protein [Mycobacterium sp. 852002-50816_SCH5313054-b]|uniref:SCP-2 sterol transfer family protein n=1 Tax=Mycobacterium sp. 852002-50816_SCH5313054-b TaxID=1834092 RepID=UPI0007FC1AE5|nr:SCP-2 sterol transfer family protein [Mycobacterium sp. 852002-50816_SCH5313054-b]OBF52075.1 SCP-2 sterol transfer family protein [Mycobacterium sp. 852002-50816_SCH5313054-b]
MAEGISSVLRRSIRHLEGEVPDSYHLLKAVLGPMVVQLDVDGDIFSLRGGDRLQVSDGAAGTSDVHITSSRAAILDLLDARVGLGEAVEGGRVCVRGALDDVQRAHDALLAYVHAAVRAPSQPGLLSELRSGAA